MQLNLKEYLRAKKAGASYAIKKSIGVKLNGRSADYIMSSPIVGCLLACQYCYVARHRPYGNPTTTYTNLDQILETTRQFWLALPKKVPNQCDPIAHTFDIGESTDLLAPRSIEITKQIIDYYTSRMQTGAPSPAKPTFATKLARGHLLPTVPEGTARVRISLMPQHLSSILEKGCAQIEDRIRSANQLISLGYEVHINFSPIVLHQNWKDSYVQLFRLVDALLCDEVKQQLKCECIFLTHSPALHNSNLRWNPEGERYLWVPQAQEFKTNQRGDNQVLRYKALTIKQKAVQEFRQLLSQELPYCEVRYIF